MKNTKDALGFEILIGNYYGYMTETNGFVSVAAGKAIKTTEAGNVTIKPEYRVGAYSTGERRKEDISKFSRSTAVKPIKLFPISINDFNQIKK